MKRLFKYLLFYSTFLTFSATAIGVIVGILNTVLIAFLNKGIAQVGHSPKALIVGFFVLCFLLPLGRVFSQTMLAYIGEKAVFDLSTGLSRQILNAPLRDLEKHGGNKLLATLTTDIGQISMALSTIPFFFMNLAIITSCIAYLFWLYWVAGAAVLTAIAIGVLVYALLLKIAMGHLGHARDEQDVMVKHYQALIDGNKELKLHAPRRGAFLGLLSSTAERVRRNNVAATLWHASGGGMSQFLTFAVIGMLVFILPMQLAALTPEIVTGYAMVLLYIAMPIDGLIQTITGMARASISAQKVEALDLELETQSIDETEEPLGTSTAWQALVLEGVTHAYHREGDDRNFTLGPINLQINAGELIFLVGGNGCGKTTLAKLILGLYRPESGLIRLDDQVVTDSNRDAYRQYFAAVFSDFFLFENLMGLEQPKVDELATQYLERLQIDHKVSVKNGRLSTLSLSQGQRKRLALLTAYLEDRPMYVFDEWAADQDPIFKKVFYDILLPNLKRRGKTILVISHDDHFFHVADRIIKMDHGQIETPVPSLAEC